MRSCLRFVASLRAARVKFVLCLVFCLSLSAILFCPAARAAENPYPLCAGANCTWYAWQVWHGWGEDMPSLGNAREWATTAPGAGYKIGKDPAERALMVMSDYCEGCIGSTTGNGGSVYGDGHVAVVIKVNGDKITIHDQAWCTAASAPFRENTFSLAQLRSVQPHLAFIYYPTSSAGKGTEQPKLFTNEFSTLGAGILGTPNHDAQKVGNGAVQVFNQPNGGTSAIFAREGAAHAYAVHTGMYDAYISLGGVDGPLGYPTSDEMGATTSPGGTKGVYQTFEQGTLHWYNGAAFFTVHDILRIYTSLGGSGGRLGFPTSNEYVVAGGWRSDFEGGYIEFYADNTSKVVYIT